MVIKECRKCGGPLEWAKSRPRCRPCDRKYSRAYMREKRTLDPELARKKHRAWRARRPHIVLQYILRARAKKAGVPFALTAADCALLLSTVTCEACGRPFSAKGEEKLSVDRVIPAQGYAAGNVAPICMRCNRIKSDASIADIRALLRYLERVNA